MYQINYCLKKTNTYANKIIFFFLRSALEKVYKWVPNWYLGNGPVRAQMTPHSYCTDAERTEATAQTAYTETDILFSAQQLVLYNCMNSNSIVTITWYTLTYY